MVPEPYSCLVLKPSPGVEPVILTIVAAPKATSTKKGVPKAPPVLELLPGPAVAQDEPSMSVGEAARLLRLPVSTLYYWIRTGRVIAIGERHSFVITHTEVARVATHMDDTGWTGPRFAIAGSLRLLRGRGLMPWYPSAITARMGSSHRVVSLQIAREGILEDDHAPRTFDGWEA